MMQVNDINRCVEILKALYPTATPQNKKLLAELGYILRQELEVVTKIEENAQELARNNAQFDVKGLLEDNKQLFMENKKLLEENVQLKSIIEVKIPTIEKNISTVGMQIGKINTLLKG